MLAHVTCSNTSIELTLIVLPLVNIFKVVDTSIVVVLTGENDVVKVAGMSIGDWVTVRVPSSEACFMVRTFRRKAVLITQRLTHI